MSHDHVEIAMWIDYLAGELDPVEAERVEAALFSCDACAAAAESVAWLGAGLMHLLPPVITREHMQRLCAERRVNINSMAPGEHRSAGFPDGGGLLIHQLGGLDLDGVDRVDLVLCSVDGEELVELADVPFDGGDVLVACQRHYLETFPADGVAVVKAWRGDAVTEAGTYRITHLI